MVLKLLSRGEINSQQWDNHIAHCPNAVCYACTWYLDIVCERWTALVVEEDGGYEMVMPIPLQRKFGFWVVQHPFYCQYLGVFAKKQLDDLQLQLFLETLCNTYRYIASYSFCPENGFQFVPEKLLQKGSATSVRTLQTHWLVIPEDKNSLENIYSTDRARNLRVAQNERWDLLTSQDPKPIVRLFKSFHQHQINGGVNAEAYRKLERIVGQAALINGLIIRYACLGGNIHAGVLILKQFQKAIYLFNASDTIGRSGHARAWLLDQYFKEVCPGTFFDFESPELQSIAKYYEGFGAKSMPYLVIQQNRLMFPLNIIQTWRKKCYRNFRSVLRPL